MWVGRVGVFCDGRGSSSGDATLIKEVRDPLDSLRSIAQVVGLAGALVSALSFQGPVQADFFVVVLGDSRILSFPHCLDGRESRVLEASHQGRVGMSIEGGTGLAGAVSFTSLGGRLAGWVFVVERPALGEAR